MKAPNLNGRAFFVYRHNLKVSIKAVASSGRLFCLRVLLSPEVPRPALGYGGDAPLGYRVYLPVVAVLNGSPDRPAPDTPHALR